MYKMCVFIRYLKSIDASFIGAYFEVDKDVLTLQKLLYSEKINMCESVL
jgi:hypothetical protein